MDKEDILDRLYFGDIIPWENHTTTPDMRAINDEINATIQELKAMISPEAKAKLQQLVNDCSDLESLAVKESFKDGYRLGVKLTSAVLCDDRTP
jgi:uncharacterized membrane-anchored protein